jgi:hypothetical protein
MVRKANIQMEKEIAENAKVNPKKFWQYANSKRKRKSGIGESCVFLLWSQLYCYILVYISLSLSRKL